MGTLISWKGRIDSHIADFDKTLAKQVLGVVLDVVTSPGKVRALPPPDQEPPAPWPAALSQVAQTLPSKHANFAVLGKGAEPFAHHLVAQTGAQPVPLHKADYIIHIDLVVADHGFAGGAINAGIPVVGIIDTNDPALAVAKRMGADVIVIPMDDNRPLSSYRVAVGLLHDLATVSGNSVAIATDGGARVVAADGAVESISTWGERQRNDRRYRSGNRARDIGGNPVSGPVWHLFPSWWPGHRYSAGH